MTGPTENRFFIDHGMIHDKKTGSHVTTDEDNVWQDGVKACCDLLNELHREAVVAEHLRGEYRVAEKLIKGFPTRKEIGDLVYEVFYGGSIAGSKERIADAIIKRFTWIVDE